MMLSGVHEAIMNTALGRRTPAPLTARDLEEVLIEAKRLVEPTHAKETRRRYAREATVFEDFCAAARAGDHRASLRRDAR
jgi:hypothetical protein